MKTKKMCFATIQIVLGIAEISCFFLYQILPQPCKRRFPEWLLKRIIQDVDTSVAI